MRDFKDIKFGYASAEAEWANAPQLLLDGYYDAQGLTAAALGSQRFLFLGYKGSGKSAVGKRLQLQAENDPNLFVSSTALEDFPFNAFGKVGTQATEPQTRYPTSWAWLILLRLVQSFAEDLGSDWAKDPATAKAIGALRAQGLLPVDDLKTLVMKSSKNSFKAKIPSLIEASTERGEVQGDLGFLTLVEHLRRLVKTFKSPSFHMLVIDGLDDILSHRQVQYESIVALIQEVARINAELVKNTIPAKINVLCRTDLFEMLPDANKNKIRRDNALTLDWYRDTHVPEATALVAMADLRIQLSTGRAKAQLGQYLPGNRGVMLNALLNNTRHTPRDLVQLLDCIQEFSKPRKFLTHEDVTNGMRLYSIDYFLPEIRDELVGSATPEEISATFSLISAMNNKSFVYGDIRNRAINSPITAQRELDLEKMLDRLYECSAIGTVVGEDTDKQHYAFKYRNRNTTVDFSERMVLHVGLRKALNIRHRAPVSKGH